LPPDDDIAGVLLGETADDDGNANAPRSVWPDVPLLRRLGWMHWAGTHWRG
jgi:hypothetical protein